MGTNGERRPRKRWPEALKREIVAATFLAGASVSVVARQYDVNANQVFSWRRRYPATPEKPQAASSPQLMPVTITAEAEVTGIMPHPPASPVAETIEIEVAGTYRVRVGSGFDARVLGRILDVLVRAGGVREKSR